MQGQPSPPARHPEGMVADATELSAASGSSSTPGVCAAALHPEPQEVETMLRTLQSLAAADVAGAEEIANLQNVPAAGACLTSA